MDETTEAALMRAGAQIERLQRELVAAQAVLPCGHHHSLMCISVETGKPLYCDMCDLWTQRNDFKTELDEARAALAAEREACADLAFDKAPTDESALHIAQAIRARGGAIAKETGK